MRALKNLHSVALIFCFASVHGQFTDVTDSFEINNVATGTYDGCGMSFFDFNYDGWDDLTLGNGAENILFYQNNNGFLEEVDLGITNIDAAQVKMVLWGDYDNDHDADLLVTHDMYPTRLWRNNGDLTFTEIAEMSGLPPGFYHYFGAGWSDVDKDSYLDLFIAEFYNPYLNPGFEYQWKFYHNNGNGTFTENTIGVGLNLTPRPAFQPVFLDYDKDGWSDLFVVIDREAWNCEMYHNNGNGTFTNVTVETNTGPDTGGPMSGTVDDMDNDGDLDIFISSDETGNVLLENTDNYFENIAVEGGVTVGAICWGALWLDYDNNSWHDLFVGTTIGLWGPYENAWFINNEDDTFSPGNAATGTTGDLSPTIVASMGDLNNDGYFDYSTNNNDPYPTVIWQNDGGGNNYLSITLQGTYSNYDAVGSWITCYAGGEEYIRYTISGENCIGQNSRKEIFGLGEVEVVDSLVVLWPLGLQEVWYNIEANQQLTLVEGVTGLVPFDISFDGSLPLCPEDSISLYAGEYPEYLWSTNETTATISVTGSGTYWVTVTDENGLENTSDFLVVDVFEETIVSATVQNISCYDEEDGSAMCIIGPGTIDTILWDNGQATPEATGLNAGTHTFAGTTTDGCAFSGQVIITQPDSILLSIATTDVLCNGEGNGTATINISGGTPPYVPDWMGNVPQQLGAGEYEVLVTDSLMCAATASYIITEPDAMIIVLDTTSQYEGGEMGTATLGITGGTPPYSVLWSNDVVDSLAITGLVAGLYSAIVTDANGCTMSINFTVSFIIGINETTGNDGLIIMPNPAHDSIEINFPANLSFIRISIFDGQGRMVFSQDAEDGLRISVAHWAAGIYTAVAAGDKEYRAMVVVE